MTSVTTVTAMNAHMHHHSARIFGGIRRTAQDKTPVAVRPTPPRQQRPRFRVHREEPQHQ